MKWMHAYIMSFLIRGEKDEHTKTILIEVIPEHPGPQISKTFIARYLIKWSNPEIKSIHGGAKLHLRKSYYMDTNFFLLIITLLLITEDFHTTHTFANQTRRKLGYIAKVLPSTAIFPFQQAITITRNFRREET